MKKQQPKPTKKKQLSKAQEIWVIHKLENLTAVQIYMKYPDMGQLCHIKEALKRYESSARLQLKAWNLYREIEVAKDININ